MDTTGHIKPKNNGYSIYNTEKTSAFYAEDPDHLWFEDKLANYSVLINLPELRQFKVPFGYNHLRVQVTSDLLDGTRTLSQGKPTLTHSNFYKRLHTLHELGFRTG